MKRFAVAIAFLMASAVHASAFEGRTGNDLKENCGIAARGPKGDGLELMMASFCMGFVTAFMVIGQNLEEPIHFCVPKGVTLSQAIDVFLKYLNDHPSELHKPAELLLILSFRDAWRCH
jgi:Rap1a immunity proteins